MPKNGGVVMVTFVPGFVSRTVRDAETVQEAEIKTLTDTVKDEAEKRRLAKGYRDAHPLPRASVADVANHVDHVRSIAGVDHVGIGSDFDGMGLGPEGLEDVSMFPNLFAELIRRGWSDADLRKLAGGNLLRTLRGAEAVAKRLQATRQPSTMTIDKAATAVP
jgi:membrane dipeptidase